MNHNDHFLIGYITKTRGLKGEFQLFFEIEDSDLLELNVIFIEISGILVPFFVRSYTVLANKTGYFFLDDIDHIDKAQELVGKKVFLPNDEKPERDPNEFFLTDLQDFMVFDEHHGELGRITEINEFPQQFVATVIYQSHEIMFPLHDEFIVEINIDEKVLKVNLPAGLIEVYLKK